MTASCRLCLLDFGGRPEFEVGLDLVKIDVPCKVPARLIIRTQLVASRTTPMPGHLPGAQPGALKIELAPWQIH